jgi:hypothetical protein
MTPMSTRRATLAGLAALASLPGSAHAQPTVSQLTAPAQRFPVYARVRGGAVGAPALWWIDGIIYAKPKSAMATPLFRVRGVSWNTVTLNAEGGLSQTMEEAGYFADLTTGTILSSWRNPLTQTDTTPEPYKMKSTQVILANGDVQRPNAPFPIEVSGGIGSVTVNGDTLWVSENFSAKVGLLSPSVEGRKPEIIPGQFRIIDSLATFSARVADVLAPDDAFVPSTLAFQETDPWFPWMKMGNIDGLQLWQLKGRKVRSVDEVPEDLRTRLRADYPKFV